MKIFGCIMKIWIYVKELQKLESKPCFTMIFIVFIIMDFFGPKSVKRQPYRVGPDTGTFDTFNNHIHFLGLGR